MISALVIQGASQNRLDHFRCMSKLNNYLFTLGNIVFFACEMSACFVFLFYIAFRFWTTPSCWVEVKPMWDLVSNKVKGSVHDTCAFYSFLV